LYLPFASFYSFSFSRPLVFFSSTIPPYDFSLFCADFHPTICSVLFSPAAPFLPPPSHPCFSCFFFAPHAPRNASPPLRAILLSEIVHSQCFRPRYRYCNWSLSPHFFTLPLLLFYNRHFPPLLPLLPPTLFFV